jgi:hypothetical protein
MNSILVQKTLFAESTEIGIGAIVALDKASPPIIQLMQRVYKKDNSSLSGNIDYLMSL